MKLGYARVSTRDQDPSHQIGPLEAAGCERVWVETASGYRDDRPQLADLLSHARAGDVIVVARLDRLGRSVRHLLVTMAEITERQIGFVSLSESIDTTTAQGRMVLTMMAAVSEFEGNLRRERQEAAWANGAQKGRPTVVTPEQLKLMRQLRTDGASYREIGQALRLPKTTVFRALSGVEATAA